VRNVSSVAARRVIMMSLGIAIPLAGSYFSVAAWRKHVERERVQTVLPSEVFASGEYLVAYVLMSSECRFCTDPNTQAALRNLRTTLRASSRGRYANVSVVAVALSDDQNRELQFIQGLGKPGEAFDELSVGGSWMNELVSQLVWRDGFGLPVVPQLVLVERRVDARSYPKHVDVGAESLLYRASGDALVKWVTEGAPLPAAVPPARADSAGSGTRPLTARG